MNSPSFLASSLYVALGGALGSWLRYVTGRLWLAAIGPSAFPWATLSVNVLGSFAMGLLAGWLARQGDAGESWRLLLGVGALGGFTTFSAFALEFGMLAERGALGTAALYVAVSLVAGIAGLFAGLALMRVAA
jgi:CrcB protein